MTSRTVEVERTVTDEEEVLFCDYCGEDEEAGKGEMRVYRHRGSPDLHLHGECSEHGLGEMGSMPTFREVSPYKLLFTMDLLITGIFFFSLALLLVGIDTGRPILYIAGGILIAIPIVSGFNDARLTRKKWNQ